MRGRPNFIVIHADQLRADCVGSYGKRRGIYTPLIDTIGYQGARFISCYASCPLCIPNRLSLLTGQEPSTHGIFTNTGIPYLPLETTLPAEMHRGGYLTAMVGRTMHTVPSSFPYGFEYYVPGDPSSSDSASDAFARYLKEHTSFEDGGYSGNGIFNNSRAAAPFHLPDDCHQTKWATNRAIEFLETRDPARPFMLFVGYYAPHSPHNPPVEYFNRYYAREDLDEPYIGDWEVPPVNSGHCMSRYVRLEGEELRAARAGYYGNIAFMDGQIGRLIEQSMRISNTYVLFTSDHGDLLGDHYMYQKNRPYQGAVHLPLLIKGPGIADSQIIDSPINWTDIMPTILDLAGIPVPNGVDGRSIVPLLQGDASASRDYVHGESTHDFFGASKVRPESDMPNFFYELGSQYLTDGHMKYIWYVSSGSEQLFDLDADYREQHDLSSDNAYAGVLALWRERMVRALSGRPEGYSDGMRLIPGKTPLRVSAKMAKLAEQRQAEGFSLLFSHSASPVDKADDLPTHLMQLV